MDEDYHRIEREMAVQNERITKLIAAAKAVLERAAAVIDKPQHVPDKLERGPVEPLTQNATQVELGRAISAALENIRDRQAVRRTISSLDKSVSDALVTYHSGASNDVGKHLET